MVKESGKLNVKDRDIVIPGQILAEGMDYLPSGKAVREDSKIISTTVGLINVRGRVLKVIPLSGRYSPSRNDTVVGRIEEIGKYGWRVDINAPYGTDLNMRDVGTSTFSARGDLSKIFSVGDYVLAGITEITDRKFIKLSTSMRPHRKLIGGILIKVSPSKIPRIIGREGSMIKLLKEESGCEIFVGQNGLVWVNGEPEKIALVSKAMKKISSDSHTKGLTEVIKKIFGEKKRNGSKK